MDENQAVNPAAAEENAEGNSADANAALQGINSNGGIPTGGIPPEGIPTGSVPGKTYNIKTIIIAVAIVFVVAVILIYSVNKFSVLGRKQAVTVTTTVNSSTSHARALKSTPVNKTYVFYGIPNPSLYIEFENGTIEGGTPYNISFSIYGLNFTKFMNSVPPPDPNYTAPIPAEYKNYTYPVWLLLQNYNSTNATTAGYMLPMESYFNGISNTTNTISSNYSSFVYVYNNNMYLPKSAVVNSDAEQARLTINHTTIYGNPAVIITLNPIYENLEQYQVMYQDGRYITLVDTYGVSGKFNTTQILDAVDSMIRQA